MVLAGVDFPPDIRVEKEASALRRAGHDVTIVCSQLRDTALRDQWEGCRVVRLPRLATLPRALNKLGMLLTFHDPQWSRALETLAAAGQVDAFHVHDLPMAGTALRVGERHGLPVIMDLHENWPAALKYYKLGGKALYSRIAGPLLSPERWEAYETRCCQKADRVLVVVDEAKARLAANGVPADKIVTIENTVDVEQFNSIPLDEDLLARYRDDFVISYIGGFGGEHRGCDTAIEAMPGILRQIPNARLLLVGHGTIKPRLEAMTAERSLRERVTFVDWQPFDKVPSFIQASAICLVPHQSNPHTEATSPHKLFQYMLLKKPVVVSSCKPLRRVIEETGGGAVFEAGNSESLAETIISLRDPATRDRLGQAGYQAVLDKYSWQATSRILLDVYRNLTSPYARR